MIERMKEIGNETGSGKHAAPPLDEGTLIHFAGLWLRAWKQQED